MTNFLLHMQQKVSYVTRGLRRFFWGLNVCSCRPASRSTSTRRYATRLAAHATTPLALFPIPNSNPR